jgi:hypothetical protein
MGNGNKKVASGTVEGQVNVEKAIPLVLLVPAMERGAGKSSLNVK